eukprot:m.284310 g.284310  ORF g.284310 m.284310 type:complete len:349 (+) comp19423_c0_seq6:332-1378(+)
MAAAAGTPTDPFDKWNTDFDAEDAACDKLKAEADNAKRLQLEALGLETKCAASLAKLRKALQLSKADLDELKKKKLISGEQHQGGSDKVQGRSEKLKKVASTLPLQKSNLLIFWLGSVDVNLASNSDRIKYKQEYEEHKLIYTYCIMTVAVLSMLLNFYLGKPFRLVDSLFHVMLVCFYGSITLREHIMIANGSNIRGWWLTHHHIAIFLSWTMMVWPSGFTYVEFHFQFMVFSVFLAIVQVLQFRYQLGKIYKERALGKQPSVDITSDMPAKADAKDWLFVPLLVFNGLVYAFQVYNAFTLFILWGHPLCAEWQVPLVGLMMIVLAIGNTVTVYRIVSAKFRKPKTR